MVAAGSVRDIWHLDAACGALVSLRYFVEMRNGHRLGHPAFAVCEHHLPRFTCGQPPPPWATYPRRVTRKEAYRWTRVACGKEARIWFPIPCCACMVEQGDRLRKQAWSSSRR